MADRLIVMKNSTTPIQGDCNAEGFENWVKVNALSISSVGSFDHETGTSSVTQTGVGVSLPFGPWIIELQQRLYQGTELGTVELVELESQVDAQNKKVWKKVRELKLEEAWVESMAHSWSGIEAHVEASIEFTRSTLTWADKVADYTRAEKV